MSRVPKNVLDLPMEQRALMALKEAVRKAVAERRKLGLSVYIWRDGKVVDVSRPKSRSRAPRASSSRTSRSGGTSR